MTQQNGHSIPCCQAHSSARAKKEPYYLRTLVDVYAPEVSSTTTKTYLDQLQAVAQATGKTLEELRATEITKLNAATCAASTDETTETPTMDSTQNMIRQVHTPTGDGILSTEPQPTTTPQATDHSPAVHPLVHTPVVSSVNLIATAPSSTAKLDFTPKS